MVCFVYIGYCWIVPCSLLAIVLIWFGFVFAHWCLFGFSLRWYFVLVVWVGVLVCGVYLGVLVVVLLFCLFWGVSCCLLLVALW